MMLALSIDWSRLANELLTAVIFSVMGIALLVLSFLVLDKLTPGSLWKELLEEHNTALGILLGAFGIGISLIIAAALI